MLRKTLQNSLKFNFIGLLKSILMFFALTIFARFLANFYHALCDQKEWMGRAIKNQIRSDLMKCLTFILEPHSKFIFSLCAAQTSNDSIYSNQSSQSSCCFIPAAVLVAAKWFSLAFKWF